MISRRLLLIAGLAATLLAAPAPADDLEWDCFGGGDFDADCSGLSGPAPFPGATDTAIFDMGGVYSVTFPLAPTTDRLIVRTGLVTFDLLGATFTLLNDQFVTPSIAVADEPVASAWLTVRDGSINAFFIDVGGLPSTLGVLELDGSGAAIDASSLLQVGRQGTGVLDVLEGGDLICGSATVAQATGSAGQATISGLGSTWSCSGLMTIGKAALGSLVINDGAVVTADDTIIAQQVDAFGTVEVTGPGTRWLIDGSLDVALNGIGELIVSDGAAVETGSFTSIGTLTTNISAGGTLENQPALGELRVEHAGTTVTVGGDLYIGLFGQGTLVVSDGGRVFVGGDLLRDPVGESVLVVELSGAGAYPAEAPAIVVDGMTDDHVVRVELIDGYVPVSGDAFTLVDTALSLGDFTVDLPPLGPTLDWTVTQDATTLAITVVNVIPGDANGDGLVNVDDIVAVILAFGRCPEPPDPCPADLTGDGQVTIDDIVEVILNFD